MNPTLRRIAGISMAAASLSLVAGACSRDDDGDTAADGTAATGGAGESVAGEIVISGSSTVEPISTRVAELYEEINPDVAVTVDGPGTGDGFAAFCAGETDISDASRPIKAEELADCEANGIDFVELKVAIDGLSVITSAENTDVECLSFADLYALVGPESSGFGSWSDATDLAAELGSDTTFPDAALDITAPGEESGTYDSFIEIALEGLAEERRQDATTRPDYVAQANDNAIIQGIEGSPSSFGWVGYAFVEEAGDRIKPLAISEEPGGECVAPTPETIASTEYPIARDLYIYVSAEAAEANPAVAGYVDFYLGDGIVAAEEVGYVALADDAIEATRSTWEARELGTRDGG